MDDTNKQSTNGVNVPPPGVSTPGPVPPPDSETMSMTRGEFKELIGEVVGETKKDFTKELEARDEKIAILMKASDTARMAYIMGLNQTEKKTTMRVSTHKDKIITGWESIEDKVWKDPSGIWHEDQIMRITLEDGKTEDVRYPAFFRILRDGKIEAEMTEKSVSNKGAVTYTLKVKGREEPIRLGEAFVN